MLLAALHLGSSRCSPKCLKASSAQSTNSRMFLASSQPPKSSNHWGCTNQCSVTFASMPCLQQTKIVHSVGTSPVSLIDSKWLHKGWSVWQVLYVIADCTLSLVCCSDRPVWPSVAYKVLPGIAGLKDHDRQECGLRAAPVQTRNQLLQRLHMSSRPARDGWN